MGPAPQKQRSRRARRLRGRMTMAVGGSVVALALVAAGCSSSSSTSGGSAAQTKVKGGTAVYALPPSTTPNYIFPFASSAYISVINASNFANLMYRPLYWFGNGSQPTAEPVAEPGERADLVGATPPRSRSSTTCGPTARPVTAHRRHVLAQHAQGRRRRPTGAPTPGSRTRSSRAQGWSSPTEIQMTTNKAYSHDLVPVQRPVARSPRCRRRGTRPRPARANCATKVSDCAAVYNYLDSQSKALTSYVGLAAVVDRGRPVEAVGVQRRRSRHVRAEPEVLRPGQADPRRSSRRCRSPRTRPSTTCCARRPPAARRSTWATCRRRTPRPSRPGPAR